MDQDDGAGFGVAGDVVLGAVVGVGVDRVGIGGDVTGVGARS